MPIATINPATGEVVKTFQPLTEAEIEKKLQLAVNTFNRERKTPFAVRAQRMLKAAEIIERDKDKFGHLMTLEMGKTYKSAVAEAVKCTSACRYYAENAERFLADELVDTGAKKSFIRYLPLGPILAVMPWNFPFWQVFRFAAPALMAGNTGLLKHASNVPRCALHIEAVFREAGFPDGAFRTLLVGSSGVPRLIGDARIEAVTLTGSEHAGRVVGEQAGRAIKKSVLELGGSDPFVVLADADVATAARTAADARLINSGQSCICAKRFIAVEPIADRFLQLFKAELSSRRMGDPLDPATQVGPQARPDLRDDLHKQVEESIKRGARRLLGGEIPAGKGAFYPATLLSAVDKGMPAFDEE